MRHGGARAGVGLPHHNTSTKAQGAPAMERAGRLSSVRTMPTAPKDVHSAKAIPIQTMFGAPLADTRG